MTPQAVEKLEHLADQLNRLREARALAGQVRPQDVPKIRALLRRMLKRFIALARKMAPKRGGFTLGSRRRSEPNLEAAERYFLVLREQFEVAHADSLQEHGRVQRELQKDVEDLAKLMRTAAQALRFLAEAAGRWNDGYSQELGMGPWV